MFSKNINRASRTLQPIYWSIEILIMAMSIGLCLEAKQSIAQQPPNPQPETAPAKVEEFDCKSPSNQTFISTNIDN
jgi:hypothetical protein